MKDGEGGFKWSKRSIVYIIHSQHCFNIYMISWLRCVTGLICMDSKLVIQVGLCGSSLNSFKLKNVCNYLNEVIQIGEHLV